MLVPRSASAEVMSSSPPAAAPRRVRGCGVLALTQGPGDEWPELSWGDAFFYYSPDGVVPARIQPFATVMTKNYPGDEASRLDRPDTFRVNIAAGKDAFLQWTGHTPREAATTALLRRP